MKKFTLLSLVVATVLFTACGEETKKTVTDAVKETAHGATEAVKETVSNAAKHVTDTVKNTAQEVTGTVTDTVKNTLTGATETVKEATSNAANAVKDEIVIKMPEKLKEAVVPKADNATGKAAYAKCAGCHGADGKTKALGKSEVLAGQSAADLATKLAEYKAGTRNIAGMGMLMKGQVEKMSDGDIKAISEYISGL